MTMAKGFLVMLAAWALLIVGLGLLSGCAAARGPVSVPADAVQEG